MIEIQTEAIMNIKPQSLICDFSAISAVIFMWQNVQKHCKKAFLSIG